MTCVVTNRSVIGTQMGSECILIVIITESHLLVVVPDHFGLYHMALSLPVQLARVIHSRTSQTVSILKGSMQLEHWRPLSLFS
jgi:hypothetical protein